MPENLHNKLILVLGATGYVGGRLVAKLLKEGYRVRAAGRSREKLQGRFWAGHPRVELVETDVHNPASLARALADVDTAYYLVHSMNPQSADFAEADRQAAANMARACAQCQVRRVIYLGGLGEDNAALSRHLQSRHEVEVILRSGPVPVTVLRAAMIIGSGSASFEILRYLVDRLPVMITPRWVNTPNQPIAIRNVIGYLYGCLQNDETVGQTYDIGGKEVLSYLELMRIYAEEAGLRRRLVIPVPVLTPRLSSLWIHLVTPVPGYIARPLAEGLRNPVICEDTRITALIPQDLLDCREAIRRALMRVNSDEVLTHWTDAGRLPQEALVQAGDPAWAGGTQFKDRRQISVDAPREKVWEVITRIGGEAGWYHGTWLWVLRGFVDRLAGGVGLGRGRRHAVNLKAGDVLDFWRVVSVVENERLLLAAEMKVPGRATLEFRIHGNDEASCTLVQEARFQPHGLWGIVYWYLVSPAHGYIFGGMIRKMAARARQG